MKKFVYKQDYKNGGYDGEIYLNKMGQDGWELVSVIYEDNDQDTTTKIYYWKKEISETKV